MAKEYQSIGPAHVFLGDPTTADGMKDLGLTQQITAALGAQSAYTTSAQTGQLPIGSSLRKISAAPMVDANLLDTSVENMQTFLQGHLEKVSTGVDPDTVSALVARPEAGIITPFTLAVIPAEEVDLGTSAPHGVWLPGAYVANIDQIFSWEALSEGDNTDSATVTVQFRACRADAAAIGTNASFIYGDPSAEGLEWTSPAAAA